MKRFALLLATTAAFAAAPVSAATITVTHFLNPASIGPSISQEALASPVSLAVGDTLDLTIKFAGNASISLSGESVIWPLLLTTGGQSDTIGQSGTLEFLGASSNIVAGQIPFSSDASFVHIGNYSGANTYRLDTNTISFSGIRQIVTITSGSVPTRDYDRISLYTDGQVNILPGGVPEPASWALMIGGFGLAGAAMRRRRAVARVTYA